MLPFVVGTRRPYGRKHDVGAKTTSKKTLGFSTRGPEGSGIWSGLGAFRAVFHLIEHGIFKRKCSECGKTYYKKAGRTEFPKSTIHADEEGCPG